MTASYEISPVEGGGFTTKSEISITIRDYDRFKMISCYANNLSLGKNFISLYKGRSQLDPTLVKAIGL